MSSFISSAAVVSARETYNLYSHLYVGGWCKIGNMAKPVQIYTIFTTHTPQTLPIQSLDLLPASRLYLCGEVHGARQNADVIWTLCRSLGIKQLALEYSASIDDFIKRAVGGGVDASLLNTVMFDRSVLSIEMLKTVVELLRTGAIDQVAYIDETFDYAIDQWRQITDPDWREVVMARAIERLDLSQPTLCVMGNWHTRPRKTSRHISALRRVRETVPEAVLIQNIYRSGAVRNAGEIIALTPRLDLPEQYKIIQRTKRDFDLVVPLAQEISSVTFPPGVSVTHSR